MSALIQLHGIGKSYGLRPVLRGITCDLERTAITVLLGANGAGKTTLLRIIAGLARPSAGMLTIGGWEMPREAEQVRAQLGIVTHLPLLYAALTAYENLRFYADLYRVPHAAERIASLLDQVGLTRRKNDPVRSFSRGMQQRLGLARALIHDPAILLFDEPYTGLDVEGSRFLDDLIRDQKSRGKTLLVSLHDLERAHELADFYLVLRNGRATIYPAVADLHMLESYVLT